FIVTLAGMLVFRGLTYLVLSNRPLGPFPKDFQRLSTGFIPDFLSFTDPSTSLIKNYLALIVVLVLVGLAVYYGFRDRNRNDAHGSENEPFLFFVLQMGIIGVVAVFLGFQLSTYRGLPNVLVVMGVLIALYTFVTNRSTIGRRIYAMGGNEKAAKLSGINTERLTFLTFVNMGVLAALAGMIIAARLNSATPKAGVGIELDVIAACFIGGASASGGVGKITGAVIGAFIMGVMNNGMSIMGLSIDYQQLVKGLVLLLAVYFDVYNKRKG
ncbi:MAG: transporter permease, partial [Rhizobium sp.]|nr:transporter permease [Rhizobium sp.]